MATYKWAGAIRALKRWAQNFNGANENKSSLNLIRSIEQSRIRQLQHISPKLELNIRGSSLCSLRAGSLRAGDCSGQSAELPRARCPRASEWHRPFSAFPTENSWVLFYWYIFSVKGRWWNCWAHVSVSKTFFLFCLLLIFLFRALFDFNTSTQICADSTTMLLYIYIYISTLSTALISASGSFNRA